MTLVISTLKKFSPLQTKKQDYHLKYPMCHSECRNVGIFSLKEATNVESGIILAISGRDTLRPLGIRFRPFANGVRGTKHHKRCGVIHKVQWMKPWV